MIENSVLKIGGNTIFKAIGSRFEKIGNWLSEYGARVISRNKPICVTNPTAKLINPFTLLITFTVNNTDKYQLVLQGDYKQKYKECEEGAISLTENDIFLIINQHQPAWFKKE